MLGSQSKKEKAKPQQRKRRMITDLPHKASSERGRFVGIFGRAEPMKDFVPMITPLLRACSNATKHIHPQPIGWMRAECPEFLPAGKQAPHYGQRKSLGNIGGRRVHPGGRKPFKAKCERTVSNSASLWMILPSAGWRGPANTDSSSSRSGARLNRMTGILRAHAEARAFPRVVMVVSSSQGAYWPILHRSASGVPSTTRQG